MKAKIRYFHSPDKMWDSADGSNTGSFCILVQVIVGPNDGPGEESFDILVCSPAYLTEQLNKDQVVPGRHRLFMAEFNRGVIEDYLKRQIEQISGSSWDKVAERVSRIGRWEFEDYKP